ncbi:hypothetical protein V6N12_068853 [Hibiscus sabdariffa]|uniref:Protein kinase domain-containing protein n=1 Tax=Hibiscus sabdariffa TaxID=183260 RepID=A0ABR2B0W0_9ROSI
MFISRHPLLRFRICSIVLALILFFVVGNPIPDCQRSCGNLTIDYPFGIGEGCFVHGFEINCNTSYSPHKSFLHFGATQHEVVDISLARNQVRISSPVVHTKGFYRNGTGIQNLDGLNLTDTPFVFNNGNKFTVIGCNALGLLFLRDGNITTGCLALCDNNFEGVTDEPCSGRDCCQTYIYDSVKTIGIFIMNLLNESSISEMYNISDVLSSKIKNSSLVVLDWVIGNETCEAAEKSWDTYACKGMNSYCLGYESDDGQGYRCSCKQGYEGNPYLSSGCQDINECMAPHNPCQGIGTCINFPGGYNCKVSKFPTLQLVLGIGSLLFLLLLAPSVYICMKKRELMNFKQKFFQQNGGLLLQQRIAFHEGSGQPTKIFTTQELAKATDNYAESRVVGRGGNGTVYRGILCDHRIIAVKKSRTVDENHIDEFINEVVVLTQINHRNVVKLLGCCLETEVPLLVYEYVPNGSLHYHIHNPNKVRLISWEDRLRIATETASALAYLHSATLPVSFARPEAQRNLSSYFIIAMQQDCLLEILEPGLTNEGNNEQLKAVANLAMRCLRLKGEKRPTMKEVAFELAGSRGIDKHPWDHFNHEESYRLLDEQLDSHVAENLSAVNLYSDMSTRQYSIHSLGTISMDFPR